MESSPNDTIKFGKKDFVGKFEGVFLDSYDVIRQLGKGGYGKVYEVMNKKTREIRACKHLSKLSIKNLEKFKREVEILRIADHPNIINFRVLNLYELFHYCDNILLLISFVLKYLQRLFLNTFLFFGCVLLYGRKLRRLYILPLLNILNDVIRIFRIILLY